MAQYMLLKKKKLSVFENTADNEYTRELLQLCQIHENILGFLYPQIRYIRDHPGSLYPALGISIIG